MLPVLAPTEDSSAPRRHLPLPAEAVARGGAPCRVEFTRHAADGADALVRGAFGHRGERGVDRAAERGRDRGQKLDGVSAA